MVLEAQPGKGGKSVTAVVCAFADERFEQTCDCVASLLAQVPSVPSVVVVVDHNSSLERKLRRALDSTVRILSNQRSRGLSGARNTGVAEATGDMVAFLDDDAIAPTDWIAKLQEGLADPDVLVVGGHAVPVWAGHPPRHFPEEFLWVVGCSYRGLPRNGPVRNALGCNMLFRSRVFAEVGGFDTSIGRFGSRPLGCEETELCIRARRRFPKAEVVMVDGATVEHSVPPSRERFSYFWRRCFYEGVSKALLRRLTDERALDTERRYASQTLRAAIGRDLRAAVALRHPKTSLLRIAWVVLGLAAATLGFAVGSIYFTPSARPPAAPRG